MKQAKKENKKTRGGDNRTPKKSKMKAGESGTIQEDRGRGDDGGDSAIAGSCCQGVTNCGGCVFCCAGESCVNGCFHCEGE
jgi:hypothetical protein